jgi:hypothetical protein
MPNVPGNFRAPSLRSPQETAMIWVADLDTGLDNLSYKYEGKWKEVCGLITQRRLESIVHEFSRYQQSLMRFYLLGDVHEYKRTVTMAVTVLCKRVNRNIIKEN